MLKGQRQNIHHTKLPKPGAVGYLIGLSAIRSRRKYIVIAYPLCDSADYRYSIGIHTMFVRFLDNCEIARFSGILFESLQ